MSPSKRSHSAPPATIADAAVRADAPTIAYTYSEPIIFYEYVRDTALQARERGVRIPMLDGGS